MALSLRRLRVVRLEIGKGHLNHQSSPNCYLFEWPVWHVERAANLRKFHDPFWAILRESENANSAKNYQCNFIWNYTYTNSMKLVALLETLSQTGSRRLLFNE